MPAYLSPEWVHAFNAALSDLDLSEAIAAAGEGSLAAADGGFAVEQVVSGVPDSIGAGSDIVRTLLTVAEGKASFELSPADAPRRNVILMVSYDDALAMARGELDPADALAAGRVRVRGELAVLVAGQSILAAAAGLLGTTLDALTDSAG